MAAFGLAWDHGKRRVLLALVALIAVVAVAVASVGGAPASIEAGRENGKNAVVVDGDGSGPISTLRLVTWG